jgi:hypothetical protein
MLQTARALERALNLSAAVLFPSNDERPPATAGVVTTSPEDGRRHESP